MFGTKTSPPCRLTVQNGCLRRGLLRAVQLSNPSADAARAEDDAGYESTSSWLRVYVISRTFAAPSGPKWIMKDSFPVVVIGVSRYEGGRDNSPRRQGHRRLVHRHESEGGGEEAGEDAVRRSRRVLEELGEKMEQ
jgi:hypothetical protein